MPSAADPKKEISPEMKAAIATVAEQFDKSAEDVIQILQAVRLRKSQDFKRASVNHNKGTDRGKQALSTSVRDNKATRGIFTAANGDIVGGNHAHEELTEQGIDQWFEISTDGSQAVATRRTDWEHGMVVDAVKAAVEDNLTSQRNFAWDEEAFQEQLNILEEHGQKFDDSVLSEGELDKIFKLTGGGGSHLKLNGEDDGEDTSESRFNVDADDLPDSPVRMLQLFLNQETYPRLMEIVQSLNERYGTDNPTDCILRAMEECFEGGDKVIAKEGNDGDDADN